MITKLRVVPVHISLPLSSTPMINLLKLTKKCLHNNFHSSVLTLAGAVIVLHYEDILGMQDECPLILCFSQSSGSGKPCYSVFLVRTSPNLGCYIVNIIIIYYTSVN